MPRSLIVSLRSSLPPSFTVGTVPHVWVVCRYGVSREKLILAPFFFSDAELNEFERSKSFEARKGFVSIGTFRHPPNKARTHTGKRRPLTR
eukprot:3115283-Pleurochrysis_carterae.AAC.2